MKDRSVDSFPLLMVGLCPAAAVSARVIDAFWMSVGVVAVLLLTTLCLCLLTRREPEGATKDAGTDPGRRLLGALVITSCLAASLEIVLTAFAPAAALSLGIYAPLVAVNCAVLGRLDVVDSATPPGRAMRDAAGTGLRFAALLVLVGLVREILGSGSITLVRVSSFSGTIAMGALGDDPARALGLAGGAFLCLGYLAAVARRLGSSRSRDAGPWRASMSWLGIIITFALVDNVILSRLLGVCPPPTAGGVRAAAWNGGAIGVLVALSTVAAWGLDAALLAPLGFTFLRVPAYVFVIVGFAYLLRLGARRISPTLAEAAGISAPAVAVNSATLGALLIIRRGEYTAIESLIAGLAVGVGYVLVGVLLSAIRERLEIERVPESMRGLPVHLISAGLLAYAFMAFDRAFLSRILGG